MKFVIFLFLALALVGCNQKEVRETYFNDGITIESKAEYHDGLKDGNETIFYSSGRPKIVSEWSKGILNGITREYDPNGTLAIVRRYYLGKKVDKSEFFDESGNLLEIQYFDSAGRLIDFKKYLKDGSIATNLEQPIGLLMKDSVNLSDTVEFNVRLGNISDFRLNKGVFIVGSEFILNNSGHPIKLRDTLVAVSSNENNYTVTTIAKKRGTNFIRGQLIYLIGGNGRDSLESFFIEQKFFVK